MMHFVWPWAFLLLPLPFFVYRFMPKAERYDAALHVPFYQDIASFQGERPDLSRSGIGRYILLIIIWFLLVCAIARPQWIGDPVAMPASGRDLLLAVDISGSMKTPDMAVGGKQVPRITLVKKVVNDFIDRRSGDRVGLLLFGTEAYIQVPLTFDRKTVEMLLNEAQLGFAGEKTSIGDAIGLAVKRLRDQPDQSRVLILLTDGRNTAGNVEPIQAAQLAARTGVRIHTVGVGAEEVMMRNLFGYHRVNPSADLDEDTLREIARLTGGRYFRARNPDELEKIYQVIDTLEPVEQEAETFRPVKALYHIPLAAALLGSFILAGLFIQFHSWGRERSS